jgi:hypothetical protein
LPLLAIGSPLGNAAEQPDAAPGGSPSLELAVRMRQFFCMSDHPPELDMLPDGRFREQPKTSLSTHVFRTAVLVAGAAGGLAIAALALWFALTLIPVAIGAALVAYGAFRFQLWRSRASAPRGRDVWRP